MKPADYSVGVLKTLSKDYDGMKKRMTDPKILDLLHGIIGISTEAGELLDQIKKHAFYGKTLDEKNLIEELGDLRFYMEVVMLRLGVTMQQIEEGNNAKLEKRYKGKEFSAEAAINRDTVAEIEAMTKAIDGPTGRCVPKNIKYKRQDFYGKEYAYCILEEEFTKLFHDMLIKDNGDGTHGYTNIGEFEAYLLYVDVNNVERRLDPLSCDELETLARARLIDLKTIEKDSKVSLKHKLSAKGLMALFYLLPLANSETKITARAMAENWID